MARQWNSVDSLVLPLQSEAVKSGSGWANHKSLKDFDDNEEEEQRLKNQHHSTLEERIED